LYDAGEVASPCFKIVRLKALGYGIGLPLRPKGYVPDKRGRAKDRRRAVMAHPHYFVIAPGKALCVSGPAAGLGGNYNWLGFGYRGLLAEAKKAQ